MINKIIDSWQKVQQDGVMLPCPRCGSLKMREELIANPLSRRCDLYICPSCGNDEALEDTPYSRSAEVEFDKLPIEAWFVCRNIYSQSNVVRKGKGFEVVATHPIFITTEDIDDIMTSALEGGITYWADDADVPEDKRVADWGHEQIARSGVLIIHDFVEDETYELTLEKFLTGFKLWAELGLDHYNAITGGTVDCCQIDSSCADSIVQLALFGEVIYG